MTSLKMRSLKTAFSKSTLLVLGLGMIATLAACGGGGHVTNTPPPAISVTLTGAPSTLAVNATAMITATVANDSSGKGVTWSCAPAGSCGTFSPATTISGAAVTYTAPATVLSSTVVITATSVADPTKSASSAAITITAAAGITVTLSSTPTTLAVNATTTITATVANDSSNLGVTWSCAPAGTCGTFSSATTLSGVAVTYTAPATVPSSTVVITATSIADSTQSASTPPITITAVITVTLSTPPPSSMAVNTTATIAATVTGDAANAGVTWSCTPVGACGSFNPTSTLSGVTTVYTAPSTVPSGGKVTIKATSVTDPTKKATQQVTITAAVTGLAPGNYVFSLLGTDKTNGVYGVAGVFTVASDGLTISGGEQDFTDTQTSTTHDLIASGTVASTSDGNLLITLTTCNGMTCTATDPNVGVAGVETLNAAVVTSAKALLTEFDASATSSGELDLQAAIPTDVCTTAPTTPCSFAFYANGLNSSGISQLAIGGVINIDQATGGISGAGSIFDENSAGILFTGQTLAASTVTTPDTFGRVLFTLNPTAAPSPKVFGFAGYIVDATKIRLIESSDPLGGTTVGTALTQTGTGTFSTASISGFNYVFGATGQDANGTLQVAGVLTFNSDLSVTGNLTFNDSAAQSPQGGNTISGGTYTVDTTGRVTVLGVTDSGVDFTYNLQLYLTGDGHATMIAMDTTNVFAGLAYQQSTLTLNAGTFNGVYGVDFQQVVAAGEQDGVGTVTADGVGTFAGTIDVNEPPTFTPTANLALSGTFAAATPNGVFTGTITDPVAGATTYNYYMVDPTLVIGIEYDALQRSLGYFQSQ